MRQFLPPPGRWPPPSGSRPFPLPAADLRLILLRVARPGEGEDSGNGCNEQPPPAGALHPGGLAAGMSSWLS